MTEAFNFLNENQEVNFQEAMNNIVLGDDPEFRLDAKAFEIGMFPQDNSLSFVLQPKAESLSAFTQKLNKGYHNFLMITPTKLRETYSEDHWMTEEKGEKTATERQGLFLRKGALNFGHERQRNVKRSNFLEVLKKKATLEELEQSIDKPYNALSEDLMQIWSFSPGKNSAFDKALEAINLKAGDLLLKQKEIARNERIGSQFHSTAEKLSQKFFSQANSIAVKSKQSEFSTGNKFVNMDNQEFSFNYEAIEEAVNEMTSATQLFGMSESVHPQTHSYEMSLNQYFNIKNAEESKKNESRKANQLPQDTCDLYETLIETSKTSGEKEINFNSLITSFSQEKKANYFYNALALAASDKITLKQKRREHYGDILITIKH